MLIINVFVNDKLTGLPATNIAVYFYLKDASISLISLVLQRISNSLSQLLNSNRWRSERYYGRRLYKGHFQE